jgi:hypothetical protein
MNILLSIFVIILMILAAIGVMVSITYVFFSKKRELSCACDRAASWQICTDISDPDSNVCEEIKDFIEAMKKLQKLFMISFHHLKAIYLFIKIKTFKTLQEIIPLEQLDNFKQKLEIAPEVIQVLKELGIDLTPEIIIDDLVDVPNIDGIEDVLKKIEQMPELLAQYNFDIENIIKNLNVPDIIKPFIPANFLSFIPGLSMPVIPELNLPNIPIMGFIKDLNLENLEVSIPDIPKLNIPKIPVIDLMPINIEELIDINFSCRIGDFPDIIINNLKNVGGFLGDFAMDPNKQVISKVSDIF